MAVLSLCFEMSFLLIPVTSEIRAILLAGTVLCAVLRLLNGPSARAEGSFGQKQVCDALRHSRRHARYNGWKTVLRLSTERVNHEFLPANGIVCCNFRT